MKLLETEDKTGKPSEKTSVTYAVMPILSMVEPHLKARRPEEVAYFLSPERKNSVNHEFYTQQNYPLGTKRK